MADIGQYVSGAQAKHERHSGWTVTAQLTDQADITQAGRAVIGVQVFFITGDGNEGSVFVANNHYTQKVVEHAIHAAAGMLDTIGKLTSAPK